MALIVRTTTFHVGHRDYVNGEIIPKEYEVDPSHDFSSAISMGRVDRLPDSAFDERVPKRSYFESVEPARKISQMLDETLDNFIDSLDRCDNEDFLNVMIRREKNNRNRSDYIEAVEDRKQELLDELSGEVE